MRCAEIERDLAAYAEEAVGRWRGIRMRAHIDHCESCQKQLAILQASRANLSGAMQEPVNAPDVADSVMALIAAEEKTTYRPRRKWAVAFATASVAAALAVGLWLSVKRPVNQPEPPLVKAPTHSPQPQKQPIPKIAKEPDAPEAPPAEIIKPPVKIHYRPKPAHLPEQHIAKAPEPTPQPEVEKQPEPEQPTPQAQPSYVVVVTTVPVIEVCSRNASDGTLTSYTRKCDEDGREQIIEVTYTPANQTMEGSKT